MFSTKSLPELCLEENWGRVSNYLHSRKSNDTKRKLLMKQDMMGCTCLHTACLKRAPNDVILSMIDIGGKNLVMMKTKHEVSIASTALHYACRNGGISGNVIKSLLDAGGKDLVLQANDYGMTALHELCDGIKKRDSNNQAMKDNISIIVKLGGRELLGKKDRNGNSALDIAITKGASEDIRAMLKLSTVLLLPISSSPSTEDIIGKIPAARKEERGHSFTYDAFLTHNWGLDTSGRDNHVRVSNFNEELKKRGYETWFDSERMRGNIEDQMCSGIDNARFVIVFVTWDYIIKVAGEGPKRSDDNCKKEFHYASSKKGADNLIVVVMEDACSNVASWRGPVGLTAGPLLYYQFLTDDMLETCVDKVAQEMKNRIRRSN